MFKRYKLFGLTAILIALFGCERGGMGNLNVDLSGLNSVQRIKWDELGGKIIYFGHQSVGYNIINGLQDILKETPDIKLNVRQSRGLEDFNGPVFAHSLVGRNEDHQFKISDFKEIIDSGIGDKADIAFFKFCYVDITRESDLNAIFNSYVQTMEYLESKYPKTTFVHITVPVRVRPAGIKNTIRSILGLSGPDLEDGLARNKFNAMLRDKFKETGRIFDLAKYESFDNPAAVDPVKQRNMFLLPAYSDDGKHLNAYGRKIIARQLLLFLSSLTQE